MISYCNAHGIGLIPYSPLQGGDLSRPIASNESTARQESVKGTPFEKQLSEADKAIIGRVEEVAKEKGWTMAQVALAWISKKVSSPIVGVTLVCDPKHI